MAADKRKRNKFLTGLLVFGIFGYFLVAIAEIVLMLEFKGYSGYSGYVIGFGLSAMFAMANVLGILLIMRWRKNGFYLLLLSLFLSAVIDHSLFEEKYSISVVYLTACLIGFAALQLKSNGKSTWSQLQPGWDPAHCRHIYQIFTAVEIILFIFTVIIFGNKIYKKNTDTIVSASVDVPKVETQTAEDQDEMQQPTEIYGEIEEVPDSIVEENQGRSYRDDNRISDKDLKKGKDGSRDESDKDRGNNKSSDNRKPKSSDDKKRKEGTEKENKSEKSGLSAAAEYLDTHDIWEREEMSQYPELKNLNSLIATSIKKGHCVLPNGLCKSSKILGIIRILLVEYEGRLHNMPPKYRNRKIDKTLHRYFDRDEISPHKLISDLKHTIDILQTEYESYKELVSDEAKNADPTFGLN